MYVYIYKYIYIKSLYIHTHTYIYTHTPYNTLISTRGINRTLQDEAVNLLIPTKCTI